MNTCTRCGATTSMTRCPFCGSSAMTPPRSPATPASPTIFHDLYRTDPPAGPSGAPQPWSTAPPAGQQSSPAARHRAAEQQPAAWAPHPDSTPQPPAPGPTAAAPDRKPRGLIIGIGAAAVVALIALVWAFGVFTRPQQAVAPPQQAPATPSTSPSPAPSSAAPSSAASSSAAPATTEPSPPASSAPSVITDPAQAQAKLAELADTGRGQVSFDGRWVAQLASKYDGVTDPQLTAMNGSHTFRFPDILNEHQTLQRSAPPDTQVVLLRSTDYGKRTVVNGQPLWVTMAVRADFTSEAAVQSWCAQRYPAVSGKDLKNICMPNRLAP